jgi:activator of 2-hydroxyglutaryl-CoA dehydratase
VAEKKKEFWRWKEYNWHDETKDWKSAETITGGVDVGSVSSQAVIMLDGELYAYSNMRTGSDSPDSARKAMDWALEGTDLTLEGIHFIVGTGYGRVNVPFSNRAITEIACHARGGNMMYGNTVRTILDMGGQDCKAILCDERGKVSNFLMNDKCAAGTGRGMEVFADLPPVSSTCVVFAKSEATSLLRDGWSKKRVLAAYCLAMASRVVGLLERIGVQKDFAITGGIAKNAGVVKRLEKELGLTALQSKYDTQIAGALGAALFAKALVEKKRKQAV